MRLVLLIIVLLLIAVQHRLWLGRGGLTEVVALRESKAQLKAEVEQQRARNATLAADVQDLKSGTEAIEERARSELGMIREGEVFYQFPKPIEAKK